MRQQPTGACNLQPRPPPHVGKPAAHDQAAEDVHRARAEAPEEDEGEAVRAVLDEIAHIFSKVAKVRATVMAAALILSPSGSNTSR